MQGFSVGLSGYNAAQAAIEVIGNNIANSATEGYHRQEVRFSALMNSTSSTLSIGDGVEITGVTRYYDDLLEKNLLLQSTNLAELSEKLNTMSSVESAFGELTADGGLNTAIDNFFTALNDITAHTDDTVWLNDLVSSANTMASKFNTLGDYLSGLKTDIVLQTQNMVEQANTLITQIADLNNQITSLSIAGSDPNNLIDQRDQYITQLSEIMSVETRAGEYNSVDVTIAGIPVVMESASMGITMGTTSEGQLGIAAEGSFNYQTGVEGGAVGGLVYLYNTFITGVEDQLNTLANTISSEINKYHVQGLSMNGSFDQLSSNRMTSAEVSSLESVEDGYIYVRVTNTSTGEVTRTAVEVDADVDTMSTIAAKITAVSGVSAVYSNSKLTINADSGYDFDFSPSITSVPTSSSLTGSSPDITCSGIYSGDINDTYTFTVSGTGSVGNGTLSVVVTNSGGDIVGTLDVGSGYAAGDTLGVAEGVEISFGVGDLNSGETFTLDVFGSSDTSGLLCAIGMNTFFTGTTASSFAVDADIIDDPTMFAGCLGADLIDNENVTKMAEVGETGLDSLGGLTPGEYYKQLVTDVGMDVATTETLVESTETMLTSLADRQSEISGVDINDEAAQLIVYQQMVQASAKFLNAIQQSLEVIMEML